MKKTFLFLLSAITIRAAAQQDFPLVSQQDGATPIYVDAQDHWLVKKAAELLQDDIERITGVKPPILTSLPAASIARLVIIGSRDHSALIQQLLKQNRLSSKQTGKWEAYTRVTLRNPTPSIG